MGWRGSSISIEPHGEEPAPGEKQRRSMIDAGAPSQEVDAWAQGLRQKMVEAGAPQDEVAKYWGDRGDPDMTKLRATVAANQSVLSPTVKEKVATSAYDAFAAGLQMSAAGLAMRGKKPDVVMPEDPTMAMRVTNMLGQAGGDIPAAIAGAVGGAAAGTAVAPGPGTILGGLTGGAALPAAIRHTLMDQYTHPDGVKTFNEFWERTAHVAWETGKETAVGVVSGKVGIKVGSMTAAGTGSVVAGGAAGFSAMVPTAVAMGAALEGKVPTADDFYAAGIVAITMGVAGKVSVSAGNQVRVKMTREGEMVSANLRDIYANTGIHPDYAVALAETDPVLKQEIIAPRDVNGRRATPAFEAKAKEMGGEPEPYHPYKPTVDRKSEEAANTPKPLKDEPENPAEAQPVEAKLSPASQVPDWMAKVDKIAPLTEEAAARYGYSAESLADPATRNGVSRTILADLSHEFKGDILNTMVAYKLGVERTRAWINEGGNFDGLPLDTQRYLMAAEANGILDRGFLASALAKTLNIQDPEDWAPGLVAPPQPWARPLGWVTDPKWKDVIATRQMPDGSVIPDPNVVADYLQKVGKLLNIRFMVGRPTATAYPHGAGSGPHQQTFFTQHQTNTQTKKGMENGVYIPNNSDELHMRWYGLNNKELIFHELSHAIDVVVNGRLRSYETDFTPALKKELVEASQKFAKKLWADNPTYRQQPRELFADALAIYMADPTIRKSMPEFTKEYGAKIKPIMDIIEGALPVKRDPKTGKWEWYDQAGQGTEEFTTAGGGGGKVPGPPKPPDGPEFTPPGKQPKKIEDASLAKLGEAELAAKINEIVAPEVARGMVPDWLNPKKLFGLFDMQLKPARAIDKMMDLKPGQVGVEDMMRQTYTSRDTAQYFLRHGTVDPLTRAHLTDANYVSAFKAVKAAGGTLDGFLAYRLAKRTVEKAGQGIDTGVDLRIAQRYLLQKGVEAKYAEGAAIIREAKDYTINYAIDSGLYSLKSGRLMKELNREHIVMRRVIDPNYDPPNYGAGSGAFRPRQPLRKMEGSDRLVIDPMTTDVDNIHTIIAMSDRNRAVGDVIGRIEAWRKAQPKQIEDGKDIPFYRVVDGPLHDPPKNAGRGVILDENGKPVPKQYEEGLAPFLAMERFGRHASPNDFPYFREGKLEVWRATDPNLAKLMRSMFAGEQSEVATLMTKFADMQRQGITTDPSFPLRTLTYGQFTSPIFAEQGSAIPYRDIVKGAVSLWKRDAKFMEWWRNGGAGASILDMNGRYMEKDVSLIFEQSGTNNMLFNTVKHPIEAFRQLGRWLDASARLGNYKFGVEGGTDPFKAAMLSRKAYLDYSEPFAVQWVNKWARTVTFMPTGFKDPEQFIQAMKDRPATTAALGVATLTSPTMFNYAMNYLADRELPEHERYSNQPQWARDTAWVLPPINGHRMRIASPPGPGTFLFKTMPERFLDYLAKDNPAEFEAWARRSVKSLWDTFETQVLPPITPVIAVPAVEHLNNRDALTGRPMIPERMKAASGVMQYQPDTTETAKALSRMFGGVPLLGGVDVSPIFIDNYAREWGGTLPFKILKVLEEKTGIKDTGKPKEPADNFFLGSFFIRNQGAGDAIDTFYGDLKELKAGQADLKLATERQDMTEIKDASTWRSAVSLQNIETALRNQRAAVQAIYRNKSLSDPEKLKYTDAIAGMMFQEAKQGSLIINELRRSRPR